MKQSVKKSYQNVEEFRDKEYEKLLQEVWQCALLNNFFWGVWALALLDVEGCTKKGIFNYDFAHCRCQSFEKIKEIMKK